MIRIYIKFRSLVPVLAILSQQINMPRVNARYSDALNTDGQHMIDESNDAHVNTTGMMYFLLLIAISVLLVVLRVLQSFPERIDQVIMTSQAKYETTLSFILTDFTHEWKIDIGWFPTCLSKFTIDSLPDIRDIQIQQRYVQESPIRVLWGNNFVVLCEGVQFSIQAPRQFKCIDKALIALIRRKLYTVNMTRAGNIANELCSVYRLTCRCGCNATRNIIHDFTPSVLQVSIQNELSGVQSRDSSVM